MIKIKQLLLTVSFVMLQASALMSQDAQLDILIKNAWVFDGTGKDSVQQDVGITKERISFVGKAGDGVKAKRVIDGDGLYLSPGFIEPHTHHDRRLSDEEAETRALLRCLQQGVTTVFMGNDGAGPMPVGEKLNEWDRDGIGVNAALLVPHGTVRAAVLGYRNIGASEEQIERMKRLVDAGMKEGAFGMSTGLFYTPGFFASTDEVIELAKVAAAYGGIYDTHQRDEGSQSVGVINSVKEVLEIGEKANIPVHISHIKVEGVDSWGKSVEIIRLIEEARKRGIKATANQYPYLASITSLSASTVPSWVRDGGTEGMRKRFKDESLRDTILRGIADNIHARVGTADRLVLFTSDRFLGGKTVDQVAQAWGVSPEEAIVRILEDKTPAALSFGMSEDDLLNFMRQPWVMVGSDGGGNAHPRSHASFTRVLRHYAMDKGIITLSEAIHKASSLTAETFHIKDRGVIKEGYYADIALFDPNTLQENATFEKPAQLSSGMVYVIVNGQVTIDKGEYSGVLAGKALRLNAQSE